MAAAADTGLLASTSDAADAAAASDEALSTTGPRSSTHVTWHLRPRAASRSAAHSSAVIPSYVSDGSASSPSKWRTHARWPCAAAEISGVIRSVPGGSAGCGVGADSPPPPPSSPSAAASAAAAAAAAEDEARLISAPCSSRQRTIGRWPW